MFTLIVSHVIVAVVAYYFGAVAMKKQIEREIFQVLKEFENKSKNK